MTLQENVTIRTKIGAGVATPAEVAALDIPLDSPKRETAARIVASVKRDTASTDIVTMADAQTAVDVSTWGVWL